MQITHHGLRVIFEHLWIKKEAEKLEQELEVWSIRSQTSISGPPLLPHSCLLSTNHEQQMQQQICMSNMLDQLTCTWSGAQEQVMKSTQQQATQQAVASQEAAVSKQAPASQQLAPQTPEKSQSTRPGFNRLRDAVHDALARPQVLFWSALHHWRERHVRSVSCSW